MEKKLFKYIVASLNCSINCKTHTHYDLGSSQRKGCFELGTHGHKRLWSSLQSSQSQSHTLSIRNFFTDNEKTNRSHQLLNSVTSSEKKTSDALVGRV
jgi:hypothetical protein